MSNGQPESTTWPSSSGGSSRPAKPRSRPSPPSPSPSLTKSSCTVRRPIETEAAKPGIGDGRGVHHGLHPDQGGSIPPTIKKINYHKEVQANIKSSQTSGSSITSRLTPPSTFTRPVPNITWTAVPSQPSQSSKKRQECDQDPRKRRRSQCEEEGSQ